jgi:tetrahedral aminopeptidase
VREKSLEFIKDLMSAPSPSGYEQPVQDVVRAYAAPFADAVRTDVMGNVIAVRNEQGSPRVMLAGHCDEIGLIVTRIDDRGYLHFTQVGGWDAGVLLGQWAEVHTATGPIKGVIGIRSFRGPNAPSRGPNVSLEWLTVDIGAASREETEKLVRVGDVITVGMPWRELRNGKMAARAWDDKCGVWVVMETLRLLQRRKFSAAVFAVSTVQEEVGIRGAKTACFGINPQVGIAVEVGFAADTPADSKKKTGDIEMGKGPIITRGANINPRVFERMTAAADAKKIAYQVEAAPGGTGTDANIMQLTRAGVATGLLEVPSRYMHTPVEVVQLKDLEDTAKLLAEFIVRLEPDADFTP